MALMNTDKIVPGSNELAWMLDDVLKAQGTRYAVLLSSDGLMLLYSGQIPKDDADRVAAAMSSVQSLSRAMMQFAGAGASMWRQTMMEFDQGFMFLAAAGQGAHLLVSTTRDVDMEDVVFRMQQLVQQLSRELATRPRIETVAQ
jgi:predicted regulator of Ras-like GTPase activity (Roadblock/LC7/MglB family)